MNIKYKILKLLFVLSCFLSYSLKFTSWKKKHLSFIPIIGFAQFVLEGHIDNDFKGLTITAIKRQLLPFLINRYGEDYRDKRKQQLIKMLEVVNKAAS